MTTAGRRHRTPAEWDWDVATVMAGGAWYSISTLNRALGATWYSDNIRLALNRLIAAGVAEIEGDRWTTLHPRYRLRRKAP